MKEMESKKRILEEAVDSLNEEIAKLKAKGNVNHGVKSCNSRIRGRGGPLTYIVFVEGNMWHSPHLLVAIPVALFNLTVEFVDGMLNSEHFK